MKRYQFKLEAVLKLRKLREENCRTELGILNRELEAITDRIAHEKNEIEKYYQIQEASLKNGASAGKLQAFPGIVAAKDKAVKLLEQQKKRQEEMIQEKKEDLAILRGELKVMENLKEKDHTEWKKAYNKDIDQKVEEQTQIWLNQREKRPQS
jgi:flagellar FliJ protein